MLKNISNTLKKNLLGVVTLAIFSMILISYFKVYIPKQEEQIDGAKFRVLSRMRGNIRNKINGLTSQINLFRGSDEIKHLLKFVEDPAESDTAKKRQILQRLVREYANLHLRINKDTVGSKIGQVKFVIYPKDLRIGVSQENDAVPTVTGGKKQFTSLDACVSWQDFLNDQLRDDFDAYIIIKDTKILYVSDSNLGIDLATEKAKVVNDAAYNKTGAKQFDSLYFQSHFHFITPSLDDIYMGGQSYKIFFFPMRMNGEGTLFLCGLVPSNVYNADIKKIPGNYAYIIGIIILLFILLFPFLKLIFMSDSERLGSSDLMMGIGSLMVFCVAATTAITLQIENDNESKNYTDANTERLSDTISTKFTSVVDAACRRMEMADSILAQEMHSCNNLYKDTANTPLHCELIDKYLTTNNSHIVDKDTIWKSVLDTDKQDPKYKLMSQAIDYSWFDSKGNRSKDWRKDAIQSPGGNFITRPYFIHALGKRGNYTPQHSLMKNTFYLEPLISWTTGDFETDISMPSYADTSEAVTSTAIKLQSYFPFVPLGYGFNIIDNKGNVMYSSDAIKNLNENMIQECSDSNSFINALHSRTREEFTVDYHGDEIKSIINPIAGTPFFLLTYSQNEFSDQRLWYTMLFSYPCMIVLFLFIVMVMLLINLLRRKSSSHNLKAINLNFDWLWPKFNKRWEYTQILIFNTGLILITMFFLQLGFIKHNYSVETNYTMFFICIFSMNILASVGLIYFLLHDKSEQTNILRVKYCFGGIFLLLEFISLSYFHFFLIVSVYALLMLGVYCLSLYLTKHIKESKQGIRTEKENATVNKTWSVLHGIIDRTPVTTYFSWVFVTWMIICSTLPCYSFINYSYNQINLRQLKDYQLYYANNYNSGFSIKADTSFVNNGDSVFFGNKKAARFVVRTDAFNEGHNGYDTLFKKVISVTDQMLASSQNKSITLDKNYSEENFRKKKDSAFQTYWWKQEDGNLVFAYNPIPIGSARAGYLIKTPLRIFINPLTKVKYYLVLILLFLAIYGLARFLLSRFYTQGFIQPANDQERKLMAMLEDDKNYRNLMISGIPSSGRLDIIEKKLEELYGKDKILEINSFINADYVDPANKITAQLLDDKCSPADLKTNQYAVVLVRRFEYNMKDLVSNRIKLNLVERLLNLSNSPRIIIIPDTEPVSALQSALTFEQHNMDEALKKEMQGDLDRWTILLSQFHNSYFYKKTNIKLHESIPGWAKDAIQKECSLGVFMPQVAAMLELDVKMKRAKDWNEIVWLTQSYSRLYYHSLWSSFSKEEKYIVYDLAIDNLFNSKNANLVNMLHQKGIFYSNPEMGNITLFNESFRNFLLTEISKEEIDSMNRMAKKKGEWSNFKTPILIIIVFMVILLTISNGNSIVSYVTMLLTGLSLIQKVFMGLSGLGFTGTPVK